jgi:lipopolysaccharide/colanic/teichoic acid biosynthesis glycosyltransferase
MSTAPIGRQNYQSHRSRHAPPTDSAEDVSASPGMKAPRQFAARTTEFPTGGRVSPSHTWYLPIKRGFDLVLAVVLLVLSAPIILLAVILIKLTSRGPALYRQVRSGKEGQPFTLLKLRTMKHNAEAETGPVWSTDNDCRVTAVGKLLRQSHLDEFPQLWNVIRGEMSLVGPRPERPEFVAKLDWEVPYYRERLAAPPGITGLAQLRLRSDTTLECVRRKVVHDVYYVRHVNPLLDFQLLVLTAWRLVMEICGFFWEFVAVPGPEEVERGFRRAIGIAHEEAPVPHITLTSITAGPEETRSGMVAFPSAGAAGAGR